MEPRPADPPRWLAAARPPVPPSDPPPPEPFSWRRITRTPRGAVGLTIATAALLLWPFSGWSALPWLAGIGLLLLLRLLRLDGLLRGWVLHLSGLVVVVGLMLSTGPWAWALAGSIGVLLAGLAQLPWWRLAAVGAVLCVVSGIGFGFASARQAQIAEAGRAQTSLENQGQIAEEADRILPVLIQTITGPQADPELLCVLLTPAAEVALAQGVGAGDCRAAGLLMHTRLQGGAASAAADPPRLTDPGGPASTEQVLDGCATAWAVAASPALGRVQIDLLDANQRTYAVVGFTSC